MVFRTTDQLGPDLEEKGPYYWDYGIDPADPSYRLGNTEVGSDGHDYTHVLAGGTLAAGARVNINETTWVATADVAGTHQVPPGLTGGVVEDEAFQARKFTL